MNTALQRKPEHRGAPIVHRLGQTQTPVAPRRCHDLASDEAGFVNGEDIVVDGGLIWGRRYSEVMRGGGAWSQLFE